MRSSDRKKRRPPRRRPTLALFMDYVDPVWQTQFDIWSGVVDAARERDANLICFAGCSLDADFTPPLEFERQRNVLYELASVESVDGIAIHVALGNTTAPERFEEFCQRYRPLPTVGIATPRAGIPSVLVDNEKGLREAIAHLVEVHGARRIAFVRGPESSEEAEQRYQIYIAALGEHDIPFDPRLVTGGDFNMDGGTRAIRTLIDERSLQVGVELEAIVAANDLMAVGAVQALHRRGISVPHEVAVVGFDDAEDARSLTPPLTTVRQPTYEEGRTAVEMLLKLLAGEEVPERTILPTQLVVRQSCGCMGQAIAEAVAEALPEIAVPAEAPAAALRRQREQILAEMAHAVATSWPMPEGHEWCAQLLDAFRAEMENERPRAFLQALEVLLRHAAAQGREVSAWQGALSALRRHSLPVLVDPETRLRAENLWQQARVAIGETMQQVQRARRLRTQQRALAVSYVHQSVSTMFDMQALADRIVQQLPQTGVKRCFISLYEDPQAPTGWARFFVGYDEEGRIDLEEERRRFPARKLAPEGVLSPEKRYALLAQALYFQDEQFGLGLFEVEPQGEETYTPLGLQISNAIKGALLVEEVKSRARELEAQNAELDAFAHTVAHDLKNPLSAMILLSTMLETRSKIMTPEEIQGSLNRITQVGRKMTDIVNALLLLASVRKEDIEPTPLQMADIVAEARNRLAALVEECQADLVAPETWPVAIGYASWIEEVWVNYISNAAKYGGHPDQGRPPRIELGFDRPATNSHIRFWVRDDGPGLTPEEQARLFAPFTRLHQVRLEGHGLGLSIVQRIIERLGGEAGVESEIGRGSTFYFTLPGTGE